VIVFGELYVAAKSECGGADKIHRRKVGFRSLENNFGSNADLRKVCTRSIVVGEANES